MWSEIGLTPASLPLCDGVLCRLRPSMAELESDATLALPDCRTPVAAVDCFLLSALPLPKLAEEALDLAVCCPPPLALDPDETGRSAFDDRWLRADEGTEGLTDPLDSTCTACSWPCCVPSPSSEYPPSA